MICNFLAFSKFLDSHRRQVKRGVSQNIIRENNMLLDFMKFATEVFEGTKYQASDIDIQKLSFNASILEDKGMNKLNRLS